MKKHEIEVWVSDIDNAMTEGLEKLRLEVKALKARLQELEDKSPPPHPLDPFVPYKPIARPIIPRQDSIRYGEPGNRAGYDPGSLRVEK